MRKKALAGFSGGMRQRFGIAQALIGNPELIIVDEPTAGLDPEERNRFLNLLAEIGENVVIILSTHIVEDVTDLCPRMAVLAGGKIQLEGAPVDLMHAARGPGLEEDHRQGRRWTTTARSHDVISTRLFAGRTVIHVAVRPPPGRRVRAGRRAGWRTSIFSTAQRLAPRRGLRDAIMFAKIAAFEFRYQLRQPAFWVIAIVFGLLAFGAVAVDNVQIGVGRQRAQERALSPWPARTSIFNVFFMLATTAIVANVVVRDDADRLRPDDPVHADHQVRLPVRPLLRRLRRRGPVLPRASPLGIAAGHAACPGSTPRRSGRSRPGDYALRLLRVRPAGRCS